MRDITKLYFFSKRECRAFQGFLTICQPKFRMITGETRKVEVTVECQRSGALESRHQCARVFLSGHARRQSRRSALESRVLRHDDINGDLRQIWH